MAQNPNVCEQLLYGRAYSVTFGSAEGGLLPRFGNLDGRMSGIRLQFEINKAAQGAANSGTITLFNISQEHRTSLVRGSQIFLRAGYQGKHDQLICGTVMKATSKRDGPNIVTELEVIDGLRGNTYASIDQNFPKGTPLYKVLEAIAKKMRLTQEVDIGIVVGIPDVTFNRGYTAQGSCRDVLEDLLVPVGLDFFIDNGLLHIIPRRSHFQREAVVLSAQTGLLGIPSLSYTTTTFNALLNPDLVPGRLVQLVTKNDKVNGFYKIRSCVMSGDTHDTKWSVACQGVLQKDAKIRILKPSNGDNFENCVVPLEPIEELTFVTGPNQSDATFLDKLPPSPI